MLGILIWGSLLKEGWQLQRLISVFPMWCQNEELNHNRFPGPRDCSPLRGSHEREPITNLSSRILRFAVLYCLEHKESRGGTDRGTHIISRALASMADLGKGE